VSEAQDSIATSASLPNGYFLEWGGQFENLAAASARLAVAVPVALTMIFLVLLMTYGTAAPALISYLNVPIAAMGGILAHGPRHRCWGGGSASSCHGGHWRTVHSHLDDLVRVALGLSAIWRGIEQVRCGHHGMKIFFPKLGQGAKYDS
jgi:hypothetical protein